MLAIVSAFLAIIPLTLWATNTWCPVRVFNLTFALGNIGALIAFGVEVNPPTKGMWFTVAFMLCLLAPAALAKLYRHGKSGLPAIGTNSSRQYLAKNRLLWGLLIASTALGLFYPLMRFQQAGFAPSATFSTKFSTIAQTIHDLTQGKNNSSGGGRSAIPLVFLYLAPLIGGQLTASSRHKLGEIVLSLIPSVVTTLVTTEKAPTILAFVLLGASAAATFFLNGGEISLNAATLAKMALAGVCAIALMAATFQIRYYGRSSRTTTEKMLRQFTDYAFGGYIGFDAWFSAENNLDAFALRGTSTFTGIPHFFGYSRAAGVYTDFTPLEANALRHVHTRTHWRCTYDDSIKPKFLLSETNIYTSLRGLVLDFGICGTLLLALCAGALDKVLFSPKRLAPLGRRLSITSIWLATCGNLFALYSWIISPFIYSSVLAALLLYLVVLFVARRRNISVADH